MLINGLAGSGGDMFPWLFRRAGLGPLIGTRTWGGLVGITGGPGAGKSTVAEAVAQCCNDLGVNAKALPMDGFHFSKEKLRELAQNFAALLSIPVSQLQLSVLGGSVILVATILTGDPVVDKQKVLYCSSIVTLMKGIIMLMIGIMILKPLRHKGFIFSIWPTTLWGNVFNFVLF